MAQETLDLTGLAYFKSKLASWIPGWFPSQTGQSGKVLTTDGSSLSWTAQAAGTDMTGATASTNGTHGLVPAPLAGEQKTYLRGDGTWQDSLDGRISNCITYIPQDINLTLSSGTLTLKAGSKLYIPNGSGVFNAVTIASDVSLKRGYSQTEFICYDADRNILKAEMVSTSYSGTTAPTSDHYMFWYDTGNNIIKWSGDYGATWESYALSLPIAIATNNNTEYVSIDQVFNGFGYIGSTIFALPGVKGLIPNGRNEDGSLKSVEVITSGVATTTNPVANLSNNGLAFTSNGIGRNYYSYDEQKNLIFSPSQSAPYSDRVMFGYFSSDANAKITAFSTKTAFHALNWSDVRSFVVETGGSSSGWYRKYSDGWLEQGGFVELTVGTSDVQFVVTLPRAFANADYVVETTIYGGWATANVANPELITTTLFNGYARSSNSSIKRIYWLASGQG